MNWMSVDEPLKGVHVSDEEPRWKYSTEQDRRAAQGVRDGATGFLWLVRGAAPLTALICLVVTWRNLAHWSHGFARVVELTAALLLAALALVLAVVSFFFPQRWRLRRSDGAFAALLVTLVVIVLNIVAA